MKITIDADDLNNAATEVFGERKTAVFLNGCSIEFESDDIAIKFCEIVFRRLNTEYVEEMACDILKKMGYTNLGAS